jgi:fatty-acyl-CoA synthase
MKLTPADRLQCRSGPLYHCFGMVLGNLACLTRSATIYPNDAFDRSASCRRCKTVHRPARRATMFIAELDHPRFQGVRSVLAAHRHHGGLAIARRSQRVVDDMHLSQITIAYGMTETSPVAARQHRHPWTNARGDRGTGAATAG